jgi:hypothetical protein
VSLCFSVDFGCLEIISFFFKFLFLFSFPHLSSPFLIILPSLCFFPSHLPCLIALPSLASLLHSVTSLPRHVAFMLLLHHLVVPRVVSLPHVALLPHAFPLCAACALIFHFHCASRAS